ncbi:sulfatase-like hydrolase/transferase [Prosthecobacter sp.]|uniref:sulfatase family protein n=1 Tax=Prosthecobacter sp. TaxID=1965333 RepID=UPI002ABB3212|nr:sulfatase-like hydrolase/transferase [Prosthecobacter sp.]MDZ4405355.1 sulfatase-like hydrolase/transferase [Prosthecobacter sp.]
MKRLALFLFALCSTLFAAQPDSAKAPTDKPNILVIIADDLGYADIGVHCGKEVPTPNIDALAASGVRCTNGYVTAPYCSPSRAGFLTGKSQTRFGHEFNPHVGDEAKLGLPLDQRTIANVLHDAGYATALVGKWHQGFDAAHHPQSRGFDEFFGFLVGGHNFLLHKDAEPEFGSAHSHDMIYRGREVQHLDGYTTDLFTDEALGFMNRNAAKPWFLYLAYNAVHTPLEIAEKLKSRIPAPVTDENRRGYLSLLLGLDDAIGRVMAEVKAKHPNTLVFFFSDNGGSGRKPFFAYNTGINTPLRGDKGQTLEGGIRVPFFVSWPGQLPAGKTYDYPVSAMDVLPTACAIANAKQPDGIEGVNLLPHLIGEKAAAPHETLAWRFGPQKAIRRGNWKLVDVRDMEAKTQSGWQLYDLSTDIGETKNLAVEKPELVAALSKAWEDWNSKNMAPQWHGSPNEDPTAPAKPAAKARQKKK